MKATNMKNEINMKKMTNMKKVSALIAVCSMGLAVQAQLIDTLTGSLGGYTDTLVLDSSSGTGLGVSFPSSASGLSASYVGTGTSAEQAMFLAPVNTFSTAFVVGDRLTVNVAVPVSSTAMDFGLAVASTATPTAAGSGNAYNSRTTFDWASISIRPSQGSVRSGSDVSGTLVTSANVLSVPSSSVSQLFIEWNSPLVFTIGYFNGSSQVTAETVTFNSGSTIGTAIGFYGDLRATGTSLGNFSNLTITAIPEPSTLAMCCIGLAGLFVGLRRKK
jgi:hypothetical protein